MYAICVKGHQEWLVVIREESTKRCGKFDGVGECYKGFVVWQNVAKLRSYLT